MRKNRGTTWLASSDHNLRFSPYIFALTRYSSSSVTIARYVSPDDSIHSFNIFDKIIQKLVVLQLWDLDFVLPLEVYLLYLDLLSLLDWSLQKWRAMLVEVLLIIHPLLNRRARLHQTLPLIVSVNWSAHVRIQFGYQVQIFQTILGDDWLNVASRRKMLVAGVVKVVLSLILKVAKRLSDSWRSRCMNKVCWIWIKWSSVPPISTLFSMSVFKVWIPSRSPQTMCIVKYVLCLLLILLKLSRLR